MRCIAVLMIVLSWQFCEYVTVRMCFGRKYTAIKGYLSIFLSLFAIVITLGNVWQSQRQSPTWMFSRNCWQISHSRQHDMWLRRTLSALNLHHGQTRPCFLLEAIDVETYVVFSPRWTTCAWECDLGTSADSVMALMLTGTEGNWWRTKQARGKFLPPEQRQDGDTSGLATYLVQTWYGPYNMVSRSRQHPAVAYVLLRITNYHSIRMHPLTILRMTPGLMSKY